MLELGLAPPLAMDEVNLAESCDRLLRQGNARAFLRYVHPAGLPEHREVGARWAGRYGCAASPEDVVICAGSQHALCCALMALFEPGDRIAADNLTYPGFKTLAGTLGLRLSPIPMDAEGMIPEDLETACRRDKIKGLYMMPNVQNPTMASMSPRRRDRIAETALRNDLLLIEDDAYALTVEGRSDPLSARMPGNSVFIAGLSKLLGTGLRVSFAVADRPWRLRLIQSVLDTICMSPTLNVALACSWIADGTADHVMEAGRREAVARNAIARQWLQGCSLTGKDTGLFVWLGLPEPWNGPGFELMAREAGVNLFSAERFVVGSAAAPAALRGFDLRPGHQGRPGTGAGGGPGIVARPASGDPTDILMPGQPAPGHIAPGPGRCRVRHAPRIALHPRILPEAPVSSMQVG